MSPKNPEVNEQENILPDGRDQDVDATDTTEALLKKNEEEEGLLKDGKDLEIQRDSDTTITPLEIRKYNGDLRTKKIKKIDDFTVVADSTQKDILIAKTKLIKDQNRETEKAKKDYLEAKKYIPDVKEEETPTEESIPTEEISVVPNENNDVPKEGDEEYDSLQKNEMVHKEQILAFNQQEKDIDNETVEQLNTFVA